jgi:LL-diaminopimelate aminotransferase
MVKLNDNIANMPANYLFKDIGERMAKFKAANPDKADKIIRLGIGDITQPIPKVAVQAGVKAVQEMGEKALGYDFAENQPFLQQAVVDYYKKQGVTLEPSEIFINDGAKPDTANIIGLFGADNKIAFPDPGYPVYVNSNAMAGRLGKWDGQKWSGAVYLPMTAGNNFVPELPKERVDLIYMCYPNNPTGAVLTREQLAEWVKYASDNNSIILYDGAYEAFITDKSVPRSIYEIPGANTCAIEFRSFSKDAGFTGVRCGYTVIPHALKVGERGLNSLWKSRLASHFNGVSYPVQCMAAAIYSVEGQAEVADILAIYKKNTVAICKGLTEAGFEVYGGVNAPYIWLKTPNGMTSWQFFDYLLETANVVGTPGSGFGPSGEGYFRLTGFGSPENTDAAVERIKKVFAKA